MQKRLPFLVILSFLGLGLFIGVSTLTSEEDGPPPGYVGQETCTTAECHASAHEGFPGHGAFSETMHNNIHQRPTPENVIIDDWFVRDSVLKDGDYGAKFDDDTLEIALSKRGTSDEYWVQVRLRGMFNDVTDNNRLKPYLDEAPWMRVAYNYGGNGWLQRFLLEYEGSHYVVPFQYVLQSYRDTETDTGFVYYLDKNRWFRPNNANSRLELFELASQEFLDQSWDRNCATCHVNGFDTATVIRQDGLVAWRAQWAGKNVDSAKRDINIAVGCESCHGPGEAHAGDPTNEDYLEVIDPARWDPTNTSRQWTDRKLDLCNQCHNRFKSTDRTWNFAYREESEQPYRPRLNLGDYWADSVADGRYWDDRKTSRAHHQQGQDYWRSAHYEQHVFPNGCFDCHNAHQTTEFPYQLDRNWYSMTAGEGCVDSDCHAGKAASTMKNGEEFNVHAQHLQKHSQCVNCHYTKTATISFVNHYEFSDHSTNVIRPTETTRFKDSRVGGMMNTCAASCHRNGYGERNSPVAFDRNASIRYSSGEIPMRAPDYGIVDRIYTQWNEQTDLDLADSLWAGYQRLWPHYTDTTMRPDTVIHQPVVSGIISLLPNPTTGPVTIRFATASQGVVRIEIYNTIGERIRVLTRRSVDAGTYNPTWDLLDGEGVPVPGGIYYVRAVGGAWDETKGVFVAR